MGTSSEGSFFSQKLVDSDKNYNDTLLSGNALKEVAATKINPCIGLITNFRLSKVVPMYNA